MKNRGFNVEGFTTKNTPRVRGFMVFVLVHIKYMQRDGVLNFM